MNDKISQTRSTKPLWAACDTFRGTISADTYKDFILTMLFLKYISDVWQDHYDEYKEQYGDAPELIEAMMANERFVLPKVPAFMRCTNAAMSRVTVSVSIRLCMQSKKPTEPN